MNHDEDKILRDEFPDLLAKLDRLGQAIEGRKYPGHAWRAAPRRRSSVLRLVFRASFAAAAAAVLLVAAATAWKLVILPAEKTPAGLPAPLGQAARGPAADEYPIPSGPDLSVASGVTWNLPPAPLPSTNKDPNSGEKIDWSIPAAAFPSMKDLDAEMEKDLTDSPAVSMNSDY